MQVNIVDRMTISVLRNLCGTPARRLSPISLESLERELEEVDPRLKGRNYEDIYRCSIVLMASVIIGNDVHRLAGFTQYPLAFVTAISFSNARGRIVGRGYSSL